MSHDLLQITSDVKVGVCVNAIFFIQLTLIVCFSETVSEVPEEDQEDTEDEEEISDYSEDGEGWRSGRRSTRKPTRRSSRKRGRHSIFKDFGKLLKDI